MIFPVPHLSPAEFRPGFSGHVHAAGRYYTGLKL
jgi:hypothetical protein